MPLTPKFPLTLVPFTNGLNSNLTRGYEYWSDSTVKDQVQLIHFHLKNILLSCSGDHIANLDMGVCLSEFLFMLEDEEYHPPSVNAMQNITPLPMKEEIKRRIKNQISIYAPYINIENVDVGVNYDQAALMIKVKYFVNLTGPNSIQDTYGIIISQYQGTVETSDQYGNGTFGGPWHDTDIEFI